MTFKEFLATAAIIIVGIFALWLFRVWTPEFLPASPLAK